MSACMLGRSARASEIALTRSAEPSAHRGIGRSAVVGLVRVGRIGTIGVARAFAPIPPMPAPLVTAAPLLAAPLVSATAVVLPVAAMALAVLPAASLTLAVLAAAGTNVAAAAIGTIEVRPAIVVGAFRVPLRAKPTAVRAFTRLAAMSTELRLRRHDDAIVMFGVLKIALGRHQVAR